MDQTELNSVFSRNGFEEISGLWCGVWKGYALSLRKITGSNYYADVAVRVSSPGPVKKSVKAILKQNCKKIAALVNLQSKVAVFNIVFSKADNLGARFTELMEGITGALMQSGAAPADTCALTGQANPDSLCLVQIGNLFCFQPVLGAAVRSQNAEVQAKVEENENNGNYLTGIIGAVLGAAVGIVVNVLIIVFLQRIFALAFALVPVASMFGYKLLKGKANKTAIIIVVLLSLIAIPVMCVLAYSLFIAKELSMSFGEVFSKVLELLQENAEIRSECFTDAPMMLLFMALGIFIAWRYMSGSLNSSVAGAASAQAASLRPNPSYHSFGRDL